MNFSTLHPPVASAHQQHSAQRCTIPLGPDHSRSLCIEIYVFMTTSTRDGSRQLTLISAANTRLCAAHLYRDWPLEFRIPPANVCETCQTNNSSSLARRFTPCASASASASANSRDDVTCLSPDVCDRFCIQSPTRQQSRKNADEVRCLTA